MPSYAVSQGECIDSIAAQNGMTWQQIWSHPENADLKELRKDPFELLPGDRVFIPEKAIKQESGGTEVRHRFRRKGVPSKFRLQVCVADEPVADTPFVAEVDGETIEGVTDTDGWIEFPIRPDAKSGELRVGEEEAAPSAQEDEDEDGLGLEAGEREQIIVVPLDFGYLDPITEITGVQQRLANIGFLVGEDGVLDEDTIEAVAEFQSKMELEPTGELDDTTRDKLKDYYGS
jgi:N-acetylmuramoyl-L-alanine amidase